MIDLDEFAEVSDRCLSAFVAAFGRPPDAVEAEMLLQTVTLHLNQRANEARVEEAARREAFASALAEKLLPMLEDKLEDLAVEWHDLGATAAEIAALKTWTRDECAKMIAEATPTIQRAISDFDAPSAALQ